MVSFSISDPMNDRRAVELGQRVAAEGGSVHAYTTLASFLIVWFRSTGYVWVPPGGSTTRAGVRYVAMTAVLGWWSLLGPFLTLAVIATNLAGGVDVTAIVAPRHQDPSVQQARVEAMAASERRQQLVLVGGLLLMLVLLVTVITTMLR